MQYRRSFDNNFKVEHLTNTQTRTVTLFLSDDEICFKIYIYMHDVRTMPMHLLDKRNKFLFYSE